MSSPQPHIHSKAIGRAELLRLFSRPETLTLQRIDRPHLCAATCSCKSLSVSCCAFLAFSRRTSKRFAPASLFLIAARCCCFTEYTLSMARATFRANRRFSSHGGSIPIQTWHSLSHSPALHTRRRFGHILRSRRY